jgi:hypothetical protein
VPQTKTITDTNATELHPSVLPSTQYHVWQAIYKQAQEQKQLDAQNAKSVSAAPKRAKPFKPKIVSPQPSKTKTTSAQEIQRQRVQSNAVKSEPKTTSVPSSRVSASVWKNQSNPLSINQTEKLLDPFKHSKIGKELTH